VPDSPSIISATPADLSTGIVLGTSIVVGFDQPINTTTLTSATFALFGPGQTQVITSEGLLANVPKVAQTNQAIPGIFTFTLVDGNTVLTFAPLIPLRPNVVYTVIAVGPDSATGVSIKGTNTATLDANYQWTFTTGDLNVSVPPSTSPLPLLLPLDPATIQIRETIFPVGNDLTQQIDFVFPGPINPASFTLSQILCSLEPILNDLSVSVPSGLATTASIAGNVLSVRITGWPTS
jgi:hypothetical protein